MEIKMVQLKSSFDKSWGAQNKSLTTVMNGNSLGKTGTEKMWAFIPNKNEVKKYNEHHQILKM
jgi:hypothetical protein